MRETLMGLRERLGPPPGLTAESLLQLRAAFLGDPGLVHDARAALEAESERAYIVRSGDLVGVVRSWAASDEFLDRWPSNEMFERIQGADAWAAVDLGPRPLVHLHVPKTAGTSLNAVLTGHFDPLEVFVQRPLRSFLSIPLARIMSLRLITGHFGMLPADLVRHRDPIVFSMVRDPYDYYPSLWRFLRKVDALDPAIPLAEWLSGRQAMPDRQAHALVFDPRNAPGFAPSGEGRTKIVGDLPLRDQAEGIIDGLTLVAPSDDVAELYREICVVAGLEASAEAFPRLNTTEPEPLDDRERELIEQKAPVDRWLYDEVVRRWARRTTSPVDRRPG
jgi:hypothetical protein